MNFIRGFLYSVGGASGLEQNSALADIRHFCASYQGIDAFDVVHRRSKSRMCIKLRHIDFLVSVLGHFLSTSVA